MRIVCVGGGPAGLYFAALAKKRDTHHDIIVIERNPAATTYGWGIVFWDSLLDKLYREDPSSASRIRNNSVLWDGEEVRVGKQTAYLAGTGFSVSRKGLVEILAHRAMDLGVVVHFNREIENVSEFMDADLIVACDGANSKIRRLYSHHFETSEEMSRNKYIWLGTHKVFAAFTFAFEQTPVGWIWFHAYAFDSQTSTCIVECSPETWRALGFDELHRDDSLRLLAYIFRDHLDGHSFVNQTGAFEHTSWLSFRRIHNKNWYHDNVVLIGDAAHTTHFAIGSGTKLAIEDAIVLAKRLHDQKDLQTSLKAYEQERSAALRSLNGGERNSTYWFDNIDNYINQTPIQFAYSLKNRRNFSPRGGYVLHLAMQNAMLRRLRQRWSFVGRCLRHASRYS